MRRVLGALLVVTACVAGSVPAAGSLLTVRVSYPSDRPFRYEGLSLAYRLSGSVNEHTAFHLSALKSSGEPGYFPEGYVDGSARGLYERGSFHLRIKDRFGFQKIVLGNYTPLFGQGLLFGGSYPLVLYNPYYDLARYRNGIYASKSASKSVLLEGIGCELDLHGMTVRPFLSWNRYDCTAGESGYYKYRDNDWDGIPNDEDDDDFTGRSEGFPKTYSCKNPLLSCIRDEPDYSNDRDRLKRNNLAEYVAGMNLSKDFDALRLGGTVHYTRFNRLIDPYYNFDPAAGDKTAFSFRGRDYFGSSLYFKVRTSVELFGEAGATLYERRSYYDEFNGTAVLSAGFTGGMRKKWNNLGVILWGGYIPAGFLNPHGLELPDGLNNIGAGVIGINSVRGGRRYAHWLYGYRELENDDLSDDYETGLSYEHRIEQPLPYDLLILTRQRFEFVDNHYYAPGLLSARIASKVSLRYAMTGETAPQLSFYNRFGCPRGEHVKTGTGIGAELLYKRSRNRASASVIYYVTDDDRFAYLYPYERPLLRWSFIAPAVHGNGFVLSGLVVRELENAVFGLKVRGVLDFHDEDRRGVTVYAMTEVPF